MVETIEFIKVVIFGGVYGEPGLIEIKEFRNEDLTECEKLAHDFFNKKKSEISNRTYSFPGTSAPFLLTNNSHIGIYIQAVY